MSFLSFNLLIFAYLLGSINSAIIICYIFKLPSPKNTGSGNPGATNVLRISGKIPASLTLLFDILKGFIPIIIAKMLTDNELIISCTVLSAILGHVFPIFFGFKGGKGVATLIGALFGFCWMLGIIFIITWISTAIVTRYSSLSALIATTIASISAILGSSLQALVPFLIITTIIFIKHRSNIQRLVSKQEKKIGEKITA